MIANCPKCVYIVTYEDWLKEGLQKMRQHFADEHPDWLREVTYIENMSKD